MDQERNWKRERINSGAYITQNQVASICHAMREFADNEERQHFYDLRNLGTDALRAWADRIEEDLTMKTTVDFIEDDPCHECKFATLIPDHLLDSYFSRRIGCFNVKRRERLVEKAMEILNTGSTPQAVTDALKYLNAANEADEFFKTHGFYKCEDSIGHPECFEQKTGGNQ